MTGVRRPFLIGLIVALAVGAAISSARPHVVERWALYLGTPQAAGSAHLFLDPFPNAFSCETRVKVFTANAEHAFCQSHFEFELGTASDTRLAADFNPFSPAAWFCIPRWAGSLAQAKAAAPR